MFILILSLLYIVSAQTSSLLPVYSRLYLRGLKRLENERIQTDYINMGITYIEHGVFTAAKKGFLKYTTEPFLGCEAYSSTELEPSNRIDKDICERIVSGIRILVSQRFPDSEILYDSNTKQYTLKWD
jgi:hypothetical protein